MSDYLPKHRKSIKVLYQIGIVLMFAFIVWEIQASIKSFGLGNTNKGGKNNEMSNAESDREGVSQKYGQFVEGFTIAGISGEFSWRDEELGEKIVRFWEEAFSSDKLEKVPVEMADTRMFIVYDNYQVTGSFRATIGYKVKNGIELPPGISKAVVFPGKYIKVENDGGALSITDVWQNLPQENVRFAYQSDFEVYTFSAAGQVKKGAIFVGIRD